MKYVPYVIFVISVGRLELLFITLYTYLLFFYFLIKLYKHIFDKLLCHTSYLYALFINFS